MPTSLITGWHDALVDQTFGQYERLRRAGCETALLVGPWTHTSALQQGWPEVLAESLAWLRAHLYADPSGLRPTAVRVHLGGDDTWRNLDAWPPAATATSWHPGPDGQLTPQAPTDSAPLTTFHYDPAEPTPSLGGPLLSRTAGPRDNRALEARDDVLTFFRVGHRIRWQISGGAHPRYARGAGAGTGTGESSVDATVFEPVRITLHAGSALLLPRDNGPA